MRGFATYDSRLTIAEPAEVRLDFGSRPVAAGNRRRSRSADFQSAVFQNLILRGPRSRFKAASFLLSRQP